MSYKRYPEAFKIEAVKQVTDRGYKVSEVVERLGVTTKSPNDWIKKYGDTGLQHQTISQQQEELRPSRTPTSSDLTALTAFIAE